MYEELIESFDMLEISDKRDQIYNELLVMLELLKKLEGSHIENDMFNIKKYIKHKHDTMDETEFLTYLYEDIYILETKILSLIGN